MPTKLEELARNYLDGLLTCDEFMKGLIVDLMNLLDSEDTHASEIAQAISTQADIAAGRAWIVVA